MNRNRKHDFDQQFFEKIDTEEKAYVLGFIYADGCNSTHPSTGCLSIVQMERDVDILIKIKKCLKSTYPITVNRVKYNGENTFRFYLYGKCLVEQLNNLGVVRNKSLILKFPNFINDELMPHFIRGYFDGDGSIWNGKRKKMTVKKENKPGEFRVRIVHNVKFNFTGSNTFIPYLQEYLMKHVGFSKTKLNYSKSKEEHKHCIMEYSGRKNIKMLYDYMYSSATIYGERKKAKFEEILCALSEKSLSEMGLIAGKPETAISSQATIVEGSSTIPEMEVESSDSKCPTLSE